MSSASPDHPSTADVYAGDIASLKRSTDVGATRYVFRVESDIEPDVFARVAGVFNIANCAPHRASLHRESPGTVSISVAIELSGASAADMIRRKLEQLTSTLSVDVAMDLSDSGGVDRT